MGAMLKASKPVSLSGCLIFLLIASCSGQDRGGSAGNRACWPIEQTWCPEHTFNSSFISFRGSGDDLVEFQGLISLFQDKCPENFAKFLCLKYFTECSDGMDLLNSPLPCRSLCENAFGECNNVIVLYGITWPRKLLCRKFPRKECILPKQTRTSGNDRLTRTTPFPVIQARNDSRLTRPTPFPAYPVLTCEPLTVSYCEEIGYSSTGFPNALGRYSDAVAAELMLPRYYPLVQMGCYDHLLEFVCRAHFPECIEGSSTSSLIMPCRSFCEAAKEACGNIVDHEILEGSRRIWPQWLSCDLFPTQNCRELPENDKRESVIESARSLLDDLAASGDSLSSHIKKLLVVTPSGAESCQRTAAVKGVEYALKGVHENVEMLSTFLRILDDDA